MNKISEVVAQVRRLAAENPDFVYEKVKSKSSEDSPKCLYTHNGKGSCIIGQAILAVDDSLYSKLADYDEGLIFGYSATIVVHDLYPEEFKKAQGEMYAKWLHLVQRKQDDGWTWEEAVGYADSFLDSGSLS